MTTGSKPAAFRFRLLASLALALCACRLEVGGRQADPWARPRAPGSEPWILPLPPARRVLYASPSGTGDGLSRAAPAALEAIAARTEPGDLVWLLGGDYVGGFDLRTHGTADAPIVYRALPGERARVVGGVEATGRHTWIWGLEITDPLDSCETGTLHAAAEGIVLVNNVLHAEGFGTSLGSWDAPGQVVYGNIVFHGHHNIYAQNDPEKGPRWFVDNISLDAKPDAAGNNGPYEFHAYAEGGHVGGFRLRGNVFANGTDPSRRVGGTALLGGKNGSANVGIEIASNHFHRVNLQLGYRRPVQAVVEGNVLYDSPLVYEWIWGRGEAKFTDPAPIVVEGNEMRWSEPFVKHVQARTSAYVSENGEIVRKEGTPPFRPADRWDRNVYSPHFRASLHAGGVETVADIDGLEAWREATGRAGKTFDADSREEPVAPGPRAFLLPNAYEAGRAHVVVYGAAGAAPVPLDLSPAVRPGAYWELRPAKDPFGEPVEKGIYLGGSAHVPAGAPFAAYLLVSRLDP